MKKVILLLSLAFAFCANAQSTDSTAICQGLFTVSADVQVRFSPGNLQYQPSTNLWRFATEQTETIVWQSNFAKYHYKGWIDLFGWGTGMNPTNFSLRNQDYSFVDWGSFCGLPTNGGKRWRVLSMDEWTYLLSKRPNARRLYAIAYINMQYGLILLPDNWKCPKGVWVKPGPKEDQANWYTLEQWAKLQAAGAVFLPAEGKRVGTELQGSASCCHYWTSTASTKKNDQALYLLLNAFVPSGQTADKHYGFSVRLVQEM